MSKRKRNAVWPYSDNEGGKTEPTCTLCGETVKTCGNTSNLLKHLKTNHEKEFKLVQEKQQEAKRLKAEQNPLKQARQLTLAAAIERTQVYGREAD